MVTLSPAPTSYTDSINDSITFISSSVDCKALAITSSDTYPHSPSVQSKIRSPGRMDSTPLSTSKVLSTPTARVNKFL